MAATWSLELDEPGEPALIELQLPASSVPAGEAVEQDEFRSGQVPAMVGPSLDTDTSVQGLLDRVAAVVGGAGQERPGNLGLPSGDGASCGEGIGVPGGVGGLMSGTQPWMVAFPYLEVWLDGVAFLAAVVGYFARGMTGRGWPSRGRSAITRKPSGVRLVSRRPPIPIIRWRSPLRPWPL